MNRHLGSLFFLKTLKWIGVLPCAIIAYLTAFYAAGLLFGILGEIFNALHLSNPDNNYDDLNWEKGGWIEIMQSIFAAYSYMLIGLWIAPKYKKSVGFVLLIFLSLTLIANGIFIFYKIEYPLYETISGLGTCWLVYYYECRNGD